MSEHAITPVPGSAVREGHAIPADLLMPGDYPLVAVCQECKKLVRCEQWLSGEWEHVTAAAPEEQLSR